jgi:hypothetical protein
MGIEDFKNTTPEFLPEEFFVGRLEGPAVSPFDYIVRGFASLRIWSREANAEALQLFRQAQQLDPNLAMAYAGASQ